MPLHLFRSSAARAFSSLFFRYLFFDRGALDTKPAMHSKAEAEARVKEAEAKARLADKANRDAHEKRAQDVEREAIQAEKKASERQKQADILKALRNPVRSNNTKSSFFYKASVEICHIGYRSNCYGTSFNIFNGIHF